MEKDLYHNIVFIKFKKHFPKTTEQEINEYFNFKEKEKIFCEYCKIELKVHQKYPYSDAPSLDHKIPKTRDGKNEFDNIAITCFQCNVVKGTMFAETYLKMLELLSVDKKWSERIRAELFLGRKANMLSRKNKKTKKPLSQEELFNFV